MQEIETPLLGASQVCPNCHFFHIHSNCGYSESKKDDLIGESVGPQKKRRRFFSKASYTDLGSESSLCGSKVLLLNCVRTLHSYGQRLYCGREWCPRCGLDESGMHKRRYARLMDKVFYLGDVGKGHGLGYFVFTVPLEIRDKLRSKTKLQNAGRAVRNLLKQHGFEIGISRWHFFGDGQIFEGELELGVYHPHLNCLVVGRWVHDKEMRIIKEAWRRYLEVLSGESIPVVDVWYQYSQEKPQWWHKAVYVTRSTFKALEGNESLAKSLYSFRNLCYWGWGKDFEKEAKLKHGRVILGLWLQGVKEADAAIVKREYDALVSVSHMKCPLCSEEGHFNVRIETTWKPDERNPEMVSRVVYELESLDPYIKKVYKSGLLVLDPIILTLKPMSEGVKEKEEVYEDYDTS